MADNTTLNAGTGGDTFRTLDDGAVKWPVGITAFATTVGTPDVLEIVTATSGLPVHQQTGATWAVSLASAPLATGAATAANQASELTALALLHTDLAGTLTVGGTVAVTGTFWQATQPVSLAGTVAVTGAGGTFPVTDSGGSLTVDAPVGTPVFVRLSDGTDPLATLPVSLASVPSHAVTNAGTFAVQAAQSGTWNVTNVSGTVSLPTGAATSANQVTELASLASIDGKVPALGQALAAASVPVVLTAAQLSTLTPLSTVAVTGVATAANQATVIASLASIDGHVDGVETSLASIDAKITAANTGAVVVASSALPSGAATAARQDTGNASLGSLDAKTPALGQALAAASVPVVLTAAQLTTLTPPAAITGFATESTLSTLNGKVTACNTGAVVLAAGTAAVGKLTANSGVTIGAVEIAAAQTLATVTAVGTVTTLTTCSTVTNLSQMNGAAIAMGTGTRSAGTQRVTIATDDVVPASQSGTWNVGTVTAVTGITNTVTVNDAPVTSGGLSVSSFLSTAAVQATQVKGSAGMVYSIALFNVGAAAVYVRLYNQTGAPAAGDNANIVWRGVVPGSTTGAGFVQTWDKGLAFSTGIGMRCTNLIGDTDNTALAASEVVGNVCYK